MEEVFEVTFFEIKGEEITLDLKCGEKRKRIVLDQKSFVARLKEAMGGKSLFQATVNRDR